LKTNTTEEIKNGTDRKRKTDFVVRSIDTRILNHLNSDGLVCMLLFGEEVLRENSHNLRLKNNLYSDDLFSVQSRKLETHTLLHLIMPTVFKHHYTLQDCLCGLVVSVLGYRSRGPGLIPSATRFSVK
jgi:hypothetical protein